MGFKYNFSFRLTTFQTRVLEYVLADWVLADQIPRNGYWHSMESSFALVLQDAISRYTQHITPFVKLPSEEHHIENLDINSLAIASVCNTITQKLHDTHTKKFRELRNAGKIDTRQMIKRA